MAGRQFTFQPQGERKGPAAAGARKKSRTGVTVPVPGYWTWVEPSCGTYPACDPACSPVAPHQSRRGTKPHPVAGSCRSPVSRRRAGLASEIPAQFADSARPARQYVAIPYQQRTDFFSGLNQARENLRQARGRGGASPTWGAGASPPTAGGRGRKPAPSPTRFSAPAKPSKAPGGAGAAGSRWAAEAAAGAPGGFTPTFAFGRPASPTPSPTGGAGTSPSFQFTGGSRASGTLFPGPPSRALTAKQLAASKRATRLQAEAEAASQAAELSGIPEGFGSQEPEPEEED